MEHGWDGIGIGVGVEVMAPKNKLKVVVEGSKLIKMGEGMRKLGGCIK